MQVLGHIVGFLVLVGMLAGMCAIAWLYVRRVRRKFREGMPSMVDPNLAAVYRVGAFDMNEIPHPEDEDDENSDDGPGIGTR